MHLNNYVVLFLISVVWAREFDPKCVVGSQFKSIVQPIPWRTVDLDSPPRERFGRAYAPYAEGIRQIISLVRETLDSFSVVPVRFFENLLGETVEKLFPANYREEIQGIADKSGVSLEDLALLNVFYEVSRYCTSILAKTPDGKLIHGRNLDFGQLFGGWNGSTHQWRLTDLLKQNSVNLNFKRNGTTLFKGTAIAGHVGLLSGYRPGAFTLTINARIRPDFRNLIRWLSHLMKPDPHLVLWALRETLTESTTFEEAKNYLASVPMIADSYFILGGKRAEDALIMVRNATDVVQVKEMGAEEWFLLQTNYDPGRKASFLDDRQVPGEKCMQQMSEVSLQQLLAVLSSTPTLNKSTVHSVLMSLSTDEYFSFVQNCSDPCWFI